ncbi:hypothetical protein A2483_00050 [Candidatus Peregrinibacteria bacterium RIFOXYC2_FULL_33_13]|nr:MAG: FeS assembly protein SufD [Candidatus Peregrinibacteria bacterium GW2011_GWA2_33_10]KKP40888.1 MAG: FeS assembly protein SufD, Fe-S cluster assembly protein SufD [Candidatus Peregrinibacteria bacterium GW2011_GWC2_33_13]OGJ53183.1 MAG: hypothetical protein A2483_00050 [Candidatus Peregrinibacteria bacterium RIFOXYC2_FULL_33_13]
MNLKILSKSDQNLKFEANSRNFIILENLNDLNFDLGSDCELNVVAILSSASDKVVNWQVNFLGENSKATCYLILVGKESNNFMINTYYNHLKGSCESVCNVRSVLFDKSKFDYRGLLKIAKGAQLTNSSLKHHTILLSEFAKVNTIPSLEIEANDVKAGHAVTIGGIDEEMLFYLQSRGIEKDSAIKLLIKGFLVSDVSMVEDEKAREMVIGKVERIVSCNP